MVGFANDQLGGFALSNNGCGATSLASGASCTFDVSWNAASGGCSVDSQRDATVIVSGTVGTCLRLFVNAICPGL